MQDSTSYPIALWPQLKPYRNITPTYLIENKSGLLKDLWGGAGNRTQSIRGMFTGLHCVEGVFVSTYYVDTPFYCTRGPGPILRSSSEPVKASQMNIIPIGGAV